MHIRQLSAVIKNYNKRIFHIEGNNDDEDLMESSDDKSILNLSNRENPALGRQGKGSTKRTKGGG